jgi:hypothetical protein
MFRAPFLINYVTHCECAFYMCNDSFMIHNASVLHHYCFMATELHCCVCMNTVFQISTFEYTGEDLVSDSVICNRS